MPKLSLGHFFIELFKRMIYVFPLILLITSFLNIINGINWIILGIKIFFYVIIYLIMVYKFSFNEYELNLVNGLFKKFKIIKNESFRKTNL